LIFDRHRHLIMTIKIAKSEETDNLLEDAGLVTLQYDTHWRQYRLRLDKAPDDKQRELLTRLIREAREGFGKPG
jgi:DNA-binding transcriptional ArsR family regulator